MSSMQHLASPPDDAISAVDFSPNRPTILAVSSWDKNVRLYDTNTPDKQPITTFEHKAPVLDVCFGKDETQVFSAGLDQLVKCLDVETGNERVLGSHDDAVRNVCYSHTTNTLITGSWDSTIRTFDPRSPQAHTGTHPQTSKVYSLSTVNEKLVIAMAGRAVDIYDLRNMAEPIQRRESSLKFQTRTVRCMPNGEGYATSSIEGRVAVEFFDPSDESQARKYAFKCHRQVEDGVDVVYPVNALAFHPVYGTFASGGGDGVVALWDAMAKRRLKQYARQGSGVAALAFSNDGRQLAIGLSNGFEDGKEGEAGTVGIVVRTLGETEGRPKNMK